MFIGLLETIVAISAVILLLRLVLPAIVAAFYIEFKVFRYLWWISVVVFVIAAPILLVSLLFALVF